MTKRTNYKKGELQEGQMSRRVGGPKRRAKCEGQKRANDVVHCRLFTFFFLYFWIAASTSNRLEHLFSITLLYFYCIISEKHLNSKNAISKKTKKKQLIWTHQPDWSRPINFEIRFSKIYFKIFQNYKKCIINMGKHLKSQPKKILRKYIFLIL